MANKSTCIECNNKIDKSYYTLSCGQLICYDCMNFIRLENEEKLYNYKCGFCNSSHNLNKNLRFTDTSIDFYNNKAEELLSVLSEFEEHKLTNIEIFRSKCEYMRDEIEITYESVIQKLNEKRLRLLEQINKHEFEFEKRLNDEQANFEYKKSFEDLKNEINEFKLSSKERICSTCHIRSYESSINQRIADYKRFLNANKDLEYEFNETIDIDPQILGYINTKPNFELKGFDFYETSLIDETSFKFEIDVEDKNETFSLHPFLENNILVCLKDSIKIFDTKGNLVSSSKSLKMSKLITTQIYNIFTINDTYLYKYDNEFNIVAQTRLQMSNEKDEILLSMCASKSYVYVLRRKHYKFDEVLDSYIYISQCLIDVYKSTDLQYIKTLAQIDITDDDLEPSDDDDSSSSNDNHIDLAPSEIYANQTHNSLYVFSTTLNVMYVLAEEKDFDKVNEVSCKYSRNDKKFIDSDETIFFTREKNGLVIRNGSQRLRLSKRNFDSIMVTHTGKFVGGRSDNKKIIVDVY